MAIALVQNKVATANSASVTTTYDAGPTDGNLLIAIGLNTTTRVFSSLSAGWTTKETDVSPPTFAGHIVVLAWKKAGAAESSDVVLTMNGSNRVWLHIFEFSGATVDSDPFDIVNAINEANGTSLAIDATGVLSQADEAIIAAAMHIDVSPITGMTWSDSFINDLYSEGAGGGSGATGTAVRVVAATTSVSTTVTFTAATAENSWGRLVSIKGLAVGGVTIPKLTLLGAG